MDLEGVQDFDLYHWATDVYFSMTLVDCYDMRRKKLSW